MSDLAQRLAEDKALRDAALGLFKADLALVRADLAERGIGQRIADRLGEGAMDMLDEAVDYAEDNQGKVAAGLAAVVLWSMYYVWRRRQYESLIGRLERELARLRNLPFTEPAPLEDLPERPDPVAAQVLASIDNDDEIGLPR